MNFDQTAKIFLIAGIALIIISFAWQMGLLQALRLGRLPGDFVVERDNLKIYFPLTTGLLISAIITFISWLIRK